MRQTKVLYRCLECGAPAAKWVGRCGECGEWNTLQDEARAGGAGVPTVSAAPSPITDVAGEASRPVPTGVAEVDRVLDGGLVPGSVTLLGGEPGIGKSTLLLQVATGVAETGRRVLLVAAEESAAQVKLRAERLGAAHPRVWISATSAISEVVEAFDASAPSVAVIDSIQTLADAEASGSPGSVAQVRACAERLVAEAKQRGLAIVLVGHVTKDGGLAGPRALEHMVDTVLSFDGDRHQGLRVLRATKHRFGPTGGVGLLEMAPDGLRGVDDASGYLLAGRHHAPGSVVVPALDGSRVLTIEVQALVASRALAKPQVRAAGLDDRRVGLALAVLDQRGGVAVAGSDVWAATVGGVRVVEAGADLGVAMAVASAAAGRPVPADVAVCGELGLSGEVRHVAQLAARIGEAARLGFRRVVVPDSVPKTRSDVELVRVGSVLDALHALHLVALDAPPWADAGRGNDAAWPRGA